MNETITNASSIVNDVLNLIQGTNIGTFANKVLIIFGGIGSITVIYFVVMMIIQYKMNRNIKDHFVDIQHLLLMVNEQNKKIENIHKILISNNIINNKYDQSTESIKSKNNKLDDDCSSDNNNNNVDNSRK